MQTFASSGAPSTLRRVQSVWLRVTAALVTALLLQACGGSDGDRDEDTASGSVREGLASVSKDNDKAHDSNAFDIRTLSSRPETVSGGDVLLEVTVPRRVALNRVRLTLNGTDVTSMFSTDPATRRMRGLLRGLMLGTNHFAAHSRGVGHGTASSRLKLINHRITGPVFSGPQLAPFECRTLESGLGAPTDSQCSATTQFKYFYFTTARRFAPLVDRTARPADLATTTTSDGKVVPYIVRVESGTINRSIYRIAVLDNPSAASAWNPASWNGRLIFTIGESTGAQYHQGANQVTDVLGTTAAQLSLSQGFAHIVSTQNVNKTNPNDVLAAEGLMMVKEHFIEAYGVPKWMMTYGGSGGAIQQLLIAQNYPGLIDGILPNAAFPDVFGTLQAVSDCRLLNRHFTAHPASDSLRRAFEGFAKKTCANWDLSNGDIIVATGGPASNCGLNDTSKVYHPITNSTGARCTVQDVSANLLGRDPDTGFARRPLDNVGVQYGLLALKSGQITPAQFLDVNEAIGGYDIDGNLIAQRTSGDLRAIRRAYEAGRVGSGAGGLASIPIMHARLWAEPAGDIHTAYNDLQIRAQLQASNGRSDNQTVWVLPHPQLALLQGGSPADVARVNAFVTQVVAQQFEVMTEWLDALAADPSASTIKKVVKHKPVRAGDACWSLDGARHDEAASLSGGLCNALYPKGLSPRLAAGGPVTDDVLKCHLKPVADEDYLPATFSASEGLRLAAIFPTGVCDYSRAGVEQSPLRGTWLKYSHRAHLW